MLIAPYEVLLQTAETWQECIFVEAGQEVEGRRKEQYQAGRCLVRRERPSHDSEATSAGDEETKLVTTCVGIPLPLPMVD